MDPVSIDAIAPKKMLVNDDAGPPGDALGEDGAAGDDGGGAPDAGCLDPARFDNNGACTPANTCACPDATGVHSETSVKSSRIPPGVVAGPVIASSVAARSSVTPRQIRD